MSARGAGPGPSVRTHTPSRTRTRTTTHTPTDSAFATQGLTNARTRLVGARTGLLADAIVGAVQIFRVARGAATRLGRQLAAVVTPAGWTLAILVPLGFVAGFWLGWIELIAAASAALVLICLAALYLISSAPLDVDLSLVSERVAVGDNASGRS